MESVTSSSSGLVQSRLMAMIRNFRVSDEQLAREIVEYFQEHPTSANGSNSYFVYDRNSIVAASWIIDHNLNRYPQITLIDDEGNEFDADIFYNSLNQVTVTFSEPTSGKAVLI